MIRKLPSIEHGEDKNLAKIDSYLQTGEYRVLLQEKVDGSQLTIFNQDGVLHYYNKSSPCNPYNDVFRDAYLQLHPHPEFFKEGFFYHGESLQNKIKRKGSSIIYRPNTCEYLRLPRYNHVVYEIVRADGYLLTPEEMKEMLAGTGIETVSIFFDSQISKLSIPIRDRISELIEGMENGTIVSGFGLKPEGMVLKVLNKVDGDKLSSTRLKFVRPIFAESNSKKKARLGEVSDADFIQELGKIYDLPGRKIKARRHLEERGQWNEMNASLDQTNASLDQNNQTKNIKAMTDELNADLLKESVEEIKDLLLIRFWPEISKAAQGDVKGFLLSLKTEKDEEEKDT